MAETTSKTDSKQRSIRNVVVTAAKVISFLLIFILLIHIVKGPLVADKDQRISKFYSEKKNSLDVIFVGSSNTYAFWSPLYAWSNFGIATYDYAAAGQAILSYRYMIEDVRKTQPDALIVVSLSRPLANCTKEYFHKLTNSMRFSSTKYRLVQAYCQHEEISWLDSMEFFFPLLLYHSRWDSLTTEDLQPDPGIDKAPNEAREYLQISNDVTSIYVTSEERRDLDEDVEEALDVLLDYCEQENVRILFLNPPQANQTWKNLKQTNTMYDMIKARGFDTLDLQFSVEDIGLDLAHDYYNYNHTNIHGSLKYTEYVAQYLLENYDLKDRRGEGAYQSFDKAFDAYVQKTAPFLFSFENNGAPRDLSLSAPTELAAEFSEEEMTATVTWEASEEVVAGYTVWRKCTMENDCWECIGTVGNAEQSFVDQDLTKGYVYNYTVVPFSEKDGERQYGNLDYLGVKITVPEEE